MDEPFNVYSLQGWMAVMQLRGRIFEIRTVIELGRIIDGFLICQSEAFYPCSGRHCLLSFTVCNSTPPFAL